MARGYVISLIMPVSGYVGFHGNCVIFGYEVGSNELLFFYGNSLIMTSVLFM